MLKFKFIISFSLLVFCFTNAYAQVPPTGEIENRMNKVKTNEDEVRRKLLERGIDIDNINPNNPAEVVKLEKALEEIEAEKKAEIERAKQDAIEEAEQKIENTADKEVEKAVDEITPEVIEEIAEEIEDGATIEEALSEGIIDVQQDNLKPANIYGQQIFRNKDITAFRSGTDMIAPDSYVLGKGDKIALSFWGDSEFEATYEINKEGYIKPQRMARINLKGITLGKAKDLLRSRFSKYYRFGKNQFEVTVSYPRTITVHIVGEVENSGSFTMPAINTAFNALAAAGGPSNIGSVRNIKLIRPDGENRVIDIYEYLLDPTITKDYYLQDNDIIHVGVAERLITIQGAVRRPFKYELKDNEQLTDLVKYSGGLSYNAYQGNFQVRRYIDDSEKIIDVDYRDLQKVNRDFNLNGGDIVEVGVIPTPYKNFVSVIGSVEIPGKYELEQGMKVSDLVKKGLLAEGSRTDIAYLLRTSDDGTLVYNKLDLKQAMDNPAAPVNLSLQPKDKLLVLSKKRFLDDYQIAIQGSVRNPSTYKYTPGDNLKITDLVTLAGGLKEDATDFAYVYRKELANSKEREYLKIDIREAIENPESNSNLVLRPNDRVQVFSIFDYTDEFQVSISGAVRKPSSFPYDINNNLKIDDLLTLSGGLRRDAADFAYVYRTLPGNSKEKEYIRVNIKNIIDSPSSSDNITLQPNDNIQIFSKLDYMDEFSVQVTGAVRRAGQYKYDSSLKLRDILTLAGGLKLGASMSRVDIFRMVLHEDQPTKSIVSTIQIDSSLNLITGNDFDLEPFDRIVVRSIPEFELQKFITIEGEVKYPGDYALLDDNEKITNIIKRSGGLTNEAFPSGASLYRESDNTGFIVLRLDKVMKNKRDRHNFILKEGDIIRIPKNKDLVSIKGATKASELYPDKILNNGKINVAYNSGKRAKWYVNEYAAGIGSKGKKKLITVEHPNGEIKRTKNFLFFKVYPKVRKGSVVTVGVKPPKPASDEDGNKKAKIDWGKVLADSVAQATAVLSLILLVQRVN